MSHLLARYYDALILQRPAIVILVAALFITFFGLHAADFKLDASADSLVLESDQALSYYRAIRARYGSDDNLIVTYTPRSDLFSDAVLDDIRALRDALAALERVKSVVTLLDVPLISSPPITLSEMSRQIRTLDSQGTDRTLARQEFTTSPLYRNLLISPDGRTTALQVNFRRDDTYHELLGQRDRLRVKRLDEKLTDQENTELAAVSRQFDNYSASLLDQQNTDIAAVRTILDKHRDRADLYLGGVPMIVADSIDFIRHDLVTFGVGVVCFLILLLAVSFRKLRWVILPMLICVITGLVMVGWLGFVDWPVTVVSSNFISLLLIITLSLTIHLIVRYRELHADRPDAGQLELVRETVRTKVESCFYTALTTIVAFGSLLFSGIRPVIDFGWMMAVGITLAFILSFTLFPAILMFLDPGPPARLRDITGAITRFFARLIRKFGHPILSVFALVMILSVIGITMLTVENRFIDYFKDDTEIYRGMELIDRTLGGTTPLDVIIDAPPEPEVDEEDLAADDFMDDLFSETEGDAGITGTSYWFNTYMLGDVAAIHDYLDELPETGKVLSIVTATRMLESLNNGKPIDDFFLSVLFKKLPADVKASLFTPYLSEDGNQLRFGIRVFESDPSLEREALIQKIRNHLVNSMKIGEDRVHVSGMLVLYNNMLQSLFRSQILTLGVVFIAIMLMFVVSFRSLKMAAIAIIPNIVAALQVLGLMGWLGIPLDIMTITIAAIVIGIAVDNTIHYVHRFTEEFGRDNDYWAAVGRCHNSIGRAMYYTAITITLGFTILALSNFVPTIYFGLLTGFSMIVALLADLTLLPLLLVMFRPLGPGEARTGGMTPAVTPG
ncbi:MAG: MMPL family transporter [Gammaproteobacteria bacterium]